MRSRVSSRGRGKLSEGGRGKLLHETVFTVPADCSVGEHDTKFGKMQPLFVDFRSPLPQVATFPRAVWTTGSEGPRGTMATAPLAPSDIGPQGGHEGPMEIMIRRVGMEDHINIVKLFQVMYETITGFY